jgi:hypothetical protein
MGGANGSRDKSAVARRAKAECAPDDKLSDTHRVTTHAKQADGFRERSTHPTGLLFVSVVLGKQGRTPVHARLGEIEEIRGRGVSKHFREFLHVHERLERGCRLVHCLEDVGFLSKRGQGRPR